METNETNKIYQRPWGTYKVLELGDNFQVKTLTVKPGAKLSLQRHFKRSEHWVVVEGAPTITVGEKIKLYQVNDHVFIPKTSLHRIENLTKEMVSIIEVQVGTYLGEDDIERLDDIYGRQDQHHGGGE